MNAPQRSIALPTPERAQPRALEALLERPWLWRGDQGARVDRASIPSGFAALDEQLPGGGWPRGALTELLTSHPGIGELRLLTPALARLAPEEGWIALVAPPYQPYAPGFASLGVDPSRLLVVEGKSESENLWAAERCLRSGNCAAVLIWAPAQESNLRRLQLAAEQGGGWGVLFSSTRQAAQPSPAPLRIQVSPARRRLDLQILKRRGGGWTPALSLELDRTGIAGAPIPVLERARPRLRPAQA